MNVMNLILTAVVFGVPIYVFWSMAWCYAKTTGTTWERLVAAFKGSMTVLWARLNTLSVAAVGGVTWVADVAGAPGVKEAITPYLAPEYMTAYVLFVLIGAEIARRRTLRS